MLCKVFCCGYFYVFLLSRQYLTKYPFAALTNYLPTPNITSDSKFFATEGNDFTLTCHVQMEHSGILYTAAFSKDGVVAKTSDYMTVSELQHEENNRQRSHLNLTVHQSIESRDDGDYKCTVMDTHNNTNSATATIKFVSEPVIDLKPINAVIKTERGKKQAVFQIEYTAYPSATFFIYNPNNEQISSDQDVMDRTKYNVKIDADNLRFTVKYPALTDFGNYTLVATTVGKNFTTSLKLVVSGELLTCCQFFINFHRFVIHIIRKTNCEHRRCLRQSWRRSARHLQGSCLSRSRNHVVVPAVPGFVNLAVMPQRENRANCKFQCSLNFLRSFRSMLSFLAKRFSQTMLTN